MQRFAFLTVDGLASGAVHAAFALSLVLIWRAARVVNFAQAALSVAAAWVAWTVGSRTGGWWLGLLLAPLAGAALGVLVERTALRRLGPEAPGGQRSHLDAVIVAFGVLMVVQAVLGMVFGLQYRAMPAPISDRVLLAGGVPTTSAYRLLVVAAVGLLVAGVAVFFTRTRLGRALRAAAAAPLTARLMGIDVTRMTTIAWGLASALGGFAAMLVLPTGLGLHPNALDGVFVTAFTAAVLGGLDSAVGAVLGGLVVGLVVSYATGYAADPNLAPVAVFALLLVVLLVRPAGLLAAGHAHGAPSGKHGRA